MAPTLAYIANAYDFATANEFNFNPDEFCICFLFRNPNQRIATDTLSWEVQAALYEKTATKKEDLQDKMWEGPRAFVHDFDQRLPKPAYRCLPSQIRGAVNESDYNENFSALFFIFELPAPDKRYHLHFRPKTVNMSFGEFQNGVRVEIEKADSTKKLKIVHYAESKGWEGDIMWQLAACAPAGKSAIAKAEPSAKKSKSKAKKPAPKKAKKSKK